MKKTYIIVIILLIINIILNWYKIHENIKLKISQERLDKTQKELNKLIKNCKY